MQKSSIDITISKQIHFINFNQDSSCFCFGTDEGYELYNCNPLKCIKKKKIEKYGICYITMLYKTNLLAFIKRDPDLLSNEETKVIIYDDKLDIVNATIQFNEKICKVLMNKKYLIISLSSEIFIYNLSNIKLLKKIEILKESKGLCSITYNSDFKLAVLDDKEGYINIWNFSNFKNPSKIGIQAHQSFINYFVFSDNGELISTCSRKGTIIRIFHTGTGQLIKELRRGSDETIINWFSFSKDNKYLLCRSKKGTVHIFHTEYKKNKQTYKNKFTYITKYLENFIPTYFQSEWSFAHFHFPNMKTVSTFLLNPNNIIVISFKGIIYKINFENKEYITIQKNSI